MLSESTARRVEDRVVLGERETVHIKGVDVGVPARRLISADVERRLKPRQESRLVGRRSEKNTIAGLLDQAGAGKGTVITVTGRPGVGKTRLVREAVAIATGSGFEVFVTYCEPHTRDVPLQVISGCCARSSASSASRLRRPGPGSAARSPRPGRGSAAAR